MSKFFEALENAEREREARERADLERYARDSGFAGVDALRRAVLRERCYARASSAPA